MRRHAHLVSGIRKFLPTILHSLDGLHMLFFGSNQSGLEISSPHAVKLIIVLISLICEKQESNLSSNWLHSTFGDLHGNHEKHPNHL